MKLKSKIKRVLSALMAVFMVWGVIGSLSILPVYAADEEEKEPIDYYTQVYNTPEEKLADMEKRAEEYGYQLYYEPNTGEVALVDTKSGQVLFSNPYDIAVNSTHFPERSPSNDIKNQLLSQIIIRFTDNDQEKNYFSYVEAAQRDQIVAKNLRNGLRVEYTIGKEETRNLVPRLINANRFQEKIRSLIDDPEALKKIDAFYTLKDPDDPKLTIRGVIELKATFPITEKMAVYVFDPYASAREINMIESYIKRFCPEYSFSELDYDHSLAEYESKETAPALFKLSLEYYLNENGMQVRLPANGLRFDESSYQLTHIQILPYMGAGSYDYDGYTMLTDGSGAIMRFEDFYGQNLTVRGKIYGQDYAFHTISGEHQEVMRLPGYGIVENVKKTVQVEETVIIPESTDDEGNVIPESEEIVVVDVDVSQDRGFFAIVTEGDALADIMTAHGGMQHKYCTVYTQFYPRPKDSYNLREAISVGANATWTVVSKRKYTGSYRIQFVMLTDDDIANEKNIKDYYEVSYSGMADAYRDHLYRNGILTPLTEADIKPDIPLYIETFGIIDTQETILSIPVMVKTPLTTFEDIKTMTDELTAEGVTNIVYRLTGYTNGGMNNTSAARVKFEKKAGGDTGYKDLVDYAAQKGIELYPDFDFAYVGRTEVFDGFNYRTDAIKTIDNRYTSRREYDSVDQSYSRTRQNAVSASVYEKLYGTYKNDADKIGINSISVSTLGSDLNSDFNKKEPYNREDTKAFTVKILEQMQSDYGKIMIDSGNAYALQYASHILYVPIDSSRYYYSSQTIPFMGMVLHGAVQFAGSPTNMTGDINYEILKMIESGSNPYFTLSYQNTEKLKDFAGLSKYYSISYEIWKNDLVEKYNLLNDALSGVQTSVISHHDFIKDAERIPSDDEIAADKAAEAAAILLIEEEAARIAEKEERAANLAARLKAQSGETTEDEDEIETDISDEEIANEEADEADAGYVPNKYTCALGTVAKVTYSNGTTFILNFNSFTINAEGKTIGPLGFVKIK